MKTYAEEPAQSVCCDKCHGLGYSRPTIKIPADHAHVAETQSTILEQLDGLKTNLAETQKILAKGFAELVKVKYLLAIEAFEHFANVEALLAVAVLRLTTLNGTFEKEVRK
jgi:hypothetical protein